MSDEKFKISNAIILGPSSSGKTSVAKYLAEKYNGERISLDGTTSSGRPIASIISISQAKKFTNEDFGILVRKQMIKEAQIASKNGKAWFIDDIDRYIFDILPKNLESKTITIVILPTIKKIIENVLQRNKDASNASEERLIINVLSQLKKFVDIRKIKDENELKKIKSEKRPFEIITNKTIITACEHDKMHYAIEDKKVWEDKVNEILAMYHFRTLKSTKLQHIELIPKNFGQKVVIYNDGEFSDLVDKVEKYLH